MTQYDAPVFIHDLLQLQRQDVAAAENRWNDLADEQRLGLLMAAGAQDRGDLMLLSRDATAVVQGLSAPMLLPVLHSADDTTAGVLLGCCNGEQINDLLDLDCRQGDLRSIRQWLAHMCALSAHAWDRIVRDLDTDLLAEAIEPFVVRIDVESDLVELYADCGVAFPFAPEQLVTRHGYAEDDLLLEFSELLWAADEGVFQHLCAALRGERVHERQERTSTNHDQRRRRMQLPTQEEAARIDDPVAVRLPTLPAGSEERALGATLPAEDILTRALSSMEPSRAEELRSDLRELAAMVALHHRFPLEAEGLARALAETNRGIALGLDHLSDGDEDSMAALLDQIEALELLRTGRSLIAALMQRGSQVDQDCALQYGSPELLLAIGVPPRVRGESGPRPIADRHDLLSALTHIEQALQS